jgi:hypothetical protein
MYFALMVYDLTDDLQKCLMYIPTAKFRCDLLSIFVDGCTVRYKAYLLFMSSFLSIFSKANKRDTQIDTIGARI